MRILMLNYEYPPLGGGAGVALRYLLTGLSESANVRVDVVTSSMTGDKVEAFSNHITFHFLDIGKTGSPHYQSAGDLIAYAVRAYCYSKGLIRQRRYDLIHAFFGIPSGYVAMKLGLPYIVSLRGSDVPFYNARFKILDTLFFRRGSRHIWRRAARVVANSEGLRRLALDTSPEQRIDVIYNAVDTDYFTPSQEKQRGPSTGELLLVSTGRLIERKGYRYLIEALESIEGARLLLIGDGNLLGELTSLADKLGVAVDFAGPKERDQVRILLQTADVFVLPSLNEGMSNAVLEAMACGLPIIATDVGGSRELVRGNGVVVPKGSSAAIAEAISEYLTDRRLLIQHRRMSRKLALTMSLSALTDQYLAVYREVTTDSREKRTK